MIRPHRRCFIAGTTARVHKNAVVRFALTTACQSSSRHLLKRAADLADDPAGGVDQDVDRADGAEVVPDGGRVGKVSGRQPTVEGDGLFVDPVHLRSVRRQGVRDRGADPRGRRQ